jgi:hypothetical protein
MLCLTLTLSGLKVQVMFRGSVIIAEYYWKTEWGENWREHQVEKLVPVYHKTNVPSPQFPQGEIHIMGT